MSTLYIRTMLKGVQANATSLKFPSDEESNRRERVSYEAMDLMNSLLQEKEHRLCSEKYSLNDYQYPRCTRGQSLSSYANAQNWDYGGHHVYPDDATDIKNHAFFHGLAWDRLHLSKPPFVPDIKSREDTRYFDDDPISDVDDASTSYSEYTESGSPFTKDCIKPISAAHADFVPKSPKFAINPKCNLMENEFIPDCGANGVGKVGLDHKSKKGREKKRPRDRILRDKDVGRKALELRKRGAFLGYTYRRHTGFLYENAL